MPVFKATIKILSNMVFYAVKFARDAITDYYHEKKG